MMPETAPTADARPQPSASIQLTWTPSRRLASDGERGSQREPDRGALQQQVDREQDHG